jgi:hypothetical protein
LDSGYNINDNYFKDTRKEQIKAWDKAVDIVSTDIGTMEIKTYHTDPQEAKQILLAVTDVLVNKNSQYQNLDNNIDIKIINQVTISKYPIKPNIVLNFIYTIIIAIVISLLYLYYISEKQYHGVDENSNNNHNKQIHKDEKNIEKPKQSELSANDIKKENNNDNENSRNTESLNESKYKENHFDDDINNENINNNEINIQEGEEINLEEEIEDDADINNLFH